MKRGCCKVNTDTFSVTERFEIYFFLYFIGYVLVWRLNNEYITAKCIHSLNIAGELQNLNLTTKDVNGLILPYKATDLGHEYCGNSTTEALAVTKEVMKGVERETLKVFATLSIPSITLTVFYGLISDYSGKRKFMMSMSSFSNAMYSLVIILDFYLGDQIGQRYLLIGAFFAGCFGNWAATTVALTTYVADVTKPKERFFRMGIVIVIMKLVYAAIDGPLIDWIRFRGFQQPIWFTFAATGLAFSLQIQVMDESQATNRDYREFKLNQFLYWLLTTKFRKVFDKYFIFLVISYSCIEFISEGYYMRLIYAAYSLAVCGEHQNFISLHYLVWNVMGCFGLIIVLIPVFRKIPDAILAIFGLVSIATGLILMPFGTKEWMFYTAFAVMFLHEVPYAALLTLASKHTDCETQAIALTVVYCCGGIAKLAALCLNHFVFYETDGNLTPNNILLWIHASLLILPAIFLLILWKIGDRTVKGDSNYKINIEEDSVSTDNSIDSDKQKLR